MAKTNTAELDLKNKYGKQLIYYVATWMHQNINQSF